MGKCVEIISIVFSPFLFPNKKHLKVYIYALPEKRFSFFFFCLFLNVPSTCNAGEPGSVPGSGRSPGEGNRLPTPVFLGFPFGSAGKESACNVGDLGSIPGLGWSPGEGKGYPLQYSGLEKFKEFQRVGHDWVTFTLLSDKSKTWQRKITLQTPSK